MFLINYFVLMNINLMDKFHRWLNRCRTCQLDAIDKSLLASFPDLQPAGALKSGLRYVCRKCGCVWYMHALTPWVTRIRPTHLAFFEKWNVSDLSLSDEQITALASIGGVVDRTGLMMHFPCSVGNGDNTIQERVLVVVAQVPPVRWPVAEKIEAIHQNIIIKSSPDALPLEIRQATFEAEEISMGYSPVGIVSPTGRYYTLGSEMHFFARDGNYGSQMKLAHGKKPGRNKIWPQDADLYYFADWNEKSRILAKESLS
jgi:hypothetical protein